MQQYQALLQRFRDNGRQTEGSLQVMDLAERPVFACDTLELPWRNNDPVTSCYPPGTYQVMKRWSNAHGWHWHVLVPNRALRLFHCGNYAGSNNPKTKTPDTKGCTLVGRGFQDITGDGQRELLNSGKTMQEFLKAVPVSSFLLHVMAPPSLVA